MKMELRIRGAHGCTVLVSAFCGNELPRGRACLCYDKGSSRSAGAERQHARNAS